MLVDSVWKSAIRDIHGNRYKEIEGTGTGEPQLALEDPANVIVWITAEGPDNIEKQNEGTAVADNV